MAKITKAVAQYKDMAASRKCATCDMFRVPTRMQPCNGDDKRIRDL